MTKFLISLAIAMLAGCVNYGAEFRPEPQAADAGTVYVYRPARSFAAIVHVDLFVDKVKKLALGNGGYGVLKLPPGDYEFAFGGRMWHARPAVHNLKIEAGREYFVKLVPSSAQEDNPSRRDLWRLGVTLLPKEEALPELQRLRLTASESCSDERSTMVYCTDDLGQIRRR